MLPSALTIAPVGAVAASSPAVPIGDGRQAAFQRALQSLVGQSVTGEVLARFDDGSFMVNVAEHGVRMQLPAEASVGNRLALTVLSANPRASFELHQPSSSVVLYGEAHASDGTADLYSPSPHGNPGSPAASGQPATAAASGASGATLASQPGGTAAASASSAGSGAAAGNPALPSAASNASGNLPTAPAAPASTASVAAQLAASAAANPALGASLLAAAGNPVPLRNPPAGRPASAAGSAADLAAVLGSDSPAADSAASATSSASGTGNASGSAAARAHSSAASLLGKAPLTALADLPGLDAGTAQPELSGAARLLGSLLGQPGSASALPLLGKTALFGHAAPDPAQLAQTLQSSIEESGLFYESHLAAWTRGERTLEQLQREPQMQAAQQAAQQAVRQDAAPLERGAAQQINQQLLAQEQARVQWQGETWPGQPLQWEIQRQSEPDQRDSRNSGGDAAPSTVWRSSLRLRFPALGNLSASITMVGQQVHLQILTEDSASHTTLRAQAPALSQSMAAAGIPLSSLNIDPDQRHDG